MKAHVSNIMNVNIKEDANSIQNSYLEFHNFEDQSNNRYKGNLSRPYSAKTPMRPNSSKSPSSKRIMPKFIENQVPTQDKSSKSILGIYGATSANNKAIIYKQVEHGNKLKPRVVQSATVRPEQQLDQQQ